MSELIPWKDVPVGAFYQCGCEHPIFRKRVSKTHSLYLSVWLDPATLVGCELLDDWLANEACFQLVSREEAITKARVRCGELGVDWWDAWGRNLSLENKTFVTAAKDMLDFFVQAYGGSYDIREHDDGDTEYEQAAGRKGGWSHRVMIRLPKYDIGMTRFAHSEEELPFTIANLLSSLWESHIGPRWWENRGS